VAGILILCSVCVITLGAPRQRAEKNGAPSTGPPERAAAGVLASAVESGTAAARDGDDALAHAASGAAPAARGA
jgi:hypothetical protein